MTKKALEISYEWTRKKGVVLPHFLTAKRVEKNNKDNAILPPFMPDFKPDGKCVTVQCSTGCYYAVVVPLIKEWLGMVGKPASRLDDQSPLLKILSVEGQLDKADKVQSYLVKLII
jgi:hypothetical protein